MLGGENQSIKPLRDLARSCVRRVLDSEGGTVLAFL